MSTASTIRLTKPRISAMILECTAAVVAVILVLWLLLWFVYQHARTLQVAAYYIQVEGALTEVPFQVADARALVDSRDAAEIPVTQATNLVGEIQQCIRSGGGPVVIYVSAPVLGTGPEAKIGGASSIKELLSILTSSQRDVVLALDLAQIDTDRDLGVFGNAPYAGLEGSVKSLVKPAKNVFVLTSAAPAQKSWSADGLGRSIFAYYLQAGLAGGAEHWDPNERDGITIEGLHRYVRQHVAKWVRDNRWAVQTPMLLPLGDSSSAMPLRRIANNPAAATPIADAKTTPGQPSPADSQTKGESKSKEESAAKDKEEPARSAESQLSPRDELLNDLIREWEKHDRLQQQRPYHYVPGAWRSYQAALLRAERQIRAGWHDPAPGSRRPATI